MQAIVLGVGKRTCRQRLTAFDAHNLAGTCGHRQREIADTAEQVEQPIARLRVEQFQRARHQHPVDLVIDLREIRRLERHRDAVLEALEVCGLQILEQHGQRRVFGPLRDGVPVAMYSCGATIFPVCPTCKSLGA